MLALAAAPRRRRSRPGPLSRAHAKLEGSGNCLAVPRPGKGPSPQRSASPATSRCSSASRRARACTRAPSTATARPATWSTRGRRRPRVVGQAGAGGASTTRPRATRSSASTRTLACDRCHKPPSYARPDDVLLLVPRGRAPRPVRRARLRRCHRRRPGSRRRASTTRRRAGPLTGGTPRWPARSATRPGSRTRRRRARATGRSARSRARRLRELPPGHAQGPPRNNCSSCHTTAGWRGDGARRRLRPLAHGLSADGPARRRGLRALPRARAAAAAGSTTRCTDCHRDPHPGRCAEARRGGRCERCHDVAASARRASARRTTRRRPTRSPARTSRWPATPATSCRGPPPGAAPPLRFASTPLRRLPPRPAPRRAGPLRREAGCEACHRVDSWRAVTFDHAQTRTRSAAATSASPASPATGAGGDGTPAAAALRRAARRPARAATATRTGPVRPHRADRLRALPHDGHGQGGAVRPRPRRRLPARRRARARSPARPATARDAGGSRASSATGRCPRSAAAATARPSRRRRRVPMRRPAFALPALGARPAARAGAGAPRPDPATRSRTARSSSSAASATTPSAGRPGRDRPASATRRRASPSRAPTAAPPAAAATGRCVFAQVGVACIDCHKDAHRGELGARCETLPHADHAGRTSARSSAPTAARASR